jgi:hypothetical protein
LSRWKIYIVSWRVSGTKNGTPVSNGTRYAVWYHDEPKPRQNGVLKAGDPSSSATKPVKIDFAKDWIDEGDQKSMWIAGAASEADVKGQRGKGYPQTAQNGGWTGHAMMRDVRRSETAATANELVARYCFLRKSNFVVSSLPLSK